MEIEEIRQRNTYNSEIDSESSLENLEGLFEFEDHERISQLRALLDKYL